MRAEEHEHAHEAAEKHPVRVTPDASAYTCSHGDEYCREVNETEVRGRKIGTRACNCECVNLRHRTDDIYDDDEKSDTCRDRVAAVVKEFSQSRAAVGPPRLFPIDSVE